MDPLTELSLTRFKRCTKCRCIKPATLAYFGKEIRTATGLTGHCRTCRYTYWKIWAKTPSGRAKMNAHHERWRKENPEAIKANDLRYRRSEKGRATESRRSKSEKRREWYRQYRRINPRKHKPLDRARARRYEARKRGAEGDHTVAEILQMYDDQRGLCAYCETPLSGSYHVDHMQPLSRGGRNDWVNLAVTCGPCNIRKHDKTVEEFMEVLMEVLME